MKNALLSTVFLAILVAACAPFSAEQAPEAYSPYYLVTVPPDATATPTPFQPFAPVALNQQSQAPQQAASPTLPAILPTNTPFPTPTTPSTVQPTPELITAAQAVIDAPESVTFLLLGSDTRGSTSFRTDTIVIAAVRPH